LGAQGIKEYNVPGKKKEALKGHAKIACLLGVGVCCWGFGWVRCGWKGSQKKGKSRKRSVNHADTGREGRRVGVRWGEINSLPHSVEANTPKGGQKRFWVKEETKTWGEKGGSDMRKRRGN